MKLTNIQVKKDDKTQTWGAEGKIKDIDCNGGFVEVKFSTSGYDLADDAHVALLSQFEGTKAIRIVHDTTGELFPKETTVEITAETAGIFKGEGEE